MVKSGSAKIQSIKNAGRNVKNYGVNSRKNEEKRGNPDPKMPLTVNRQFFTASFFENLLLSLCTDWQTTRPPMSSTYLIYYGTTIWTTAKFTILPTYCLTYHW